MDCPTYTVTQPTTNHRLVLEVGGTSNSSKPSSLPPSAVVIDAAKLPNPYTAIDKKLLDLSAPKIVDWMEVTHPNARDHIEKIVERAKAAFSCDRSVRVECFGGAHRSQAVAWKILDAIDELAIYDVGAVCPDDEPLPELLPYTSVFRGRSHLYSSSP